MAVDPGDDTTADNPQSWNKYAYVRNNPIALLDPDGRDADAYNHAQMDRLMSGQLTPQGMQQAQQGAAAAFANITDPTQTGCATVEAVYSGGSSTQIAAAVAIDAGRATVGVGMALAGGSLAQGLLTRATSTTVVHYTDEATMGLIGESGELRAGSFVTKPGEVPVGATAAKVEQTLEIGAGKGQASVTTTTPNSNLSVPSNGPKTSGGAWQRQVKTPTPVSPGNVKKTGG